MLLAIDIGNTNIVVGVYDGSTLKDHFRLETRHGMTADEAGMFMTWVLERMKIANEEIDSVIIGSVVPPLSELFETTAKKHFGCHPILVSARIDLPIKIEIDRPDEVGADRIANSVAAFARFGGPVIVVDFGTATTFDVISREGAYIGGLIIPGPETSAAELARRAARLFEVRIEAPNRVVGKSTAEALKSGLFYGAVGQVDYIIDKIIEETGEAKTKLVATGGLANRIAEHSRHLELIEPTLTLDGLRLIAESLT